MKMKFLSLLTTFLAIGIVPMFAATETKIDPEKLKKLQNNYDETKETEQSKANRLLTSASSAATGIGGMELAQGLSEQRADRVAEQSMSAYIATMRCSYGNGKQVKAGTEEIELPGGNDGNIMKYRAEYVTLAADLKERKTALGLKPGIESEEILDKSQMGLYDDENIGISDGAYASLYRAQMLGSEKDQEQIDDAKQTSKNRVIGGAVAAGVGVVGGIVGDELINQSLSSSTKTAQTCTESGGTWQGGRCHCPDGFIQHTKTGPCFAEQEDQGTITPLPGQSSSSLNSNDNSDDNANDGNGSGGTDNYNSDSNSGNGGNNPSASADNEDTEVISEKPKIAGQQIVAVAPNGNNYKLDEINQDGSPKSSPAPKIQSDNTNNDEDEKDMSNANKDNKVDDKNNSIDVNVSAAQGGDSGTISTTTANPNNGNNASNSNVNPSNAGGSDDSFTETNNSAKTPAATEQRNVTERSQTKSTPPRANATNGRTTNNNDLSKQDMSKNGTFAKAYGTDGKCSVYQNKSWADKSTSWCDDLYKGEWKVQFDYGLVRGKTACDTDGGVEKRLGTPAGKAGQYCWCKVTQYTPNGGAAKNLSLSWMYNKGDSSKGSCEYHCALWCASDIRTDPSIRQKMFNAK